MSRSHEPFDWYRVVYAVTFVGLSAFFWHEFQPSDQGSWIIWLGLTLTTLVLFLPNLFPDHLYRWKKVDDRLMGRSFFAARLYMVALALLSFAVVVIGFTVIEYFRR